MKRKTVERDSIINMAVALIRLELPFEYTPNKLATGMVASGTFTSDEDMTEAAKEVAELRRKRKKL